MYRIGPRPSEAKYKLFWSKTFYGQINMGSNR